STVAQSLISWSTSVRPAAARMDKMPTSINASVVRANAALQNALTKTAVQRLDKSAKAPL
ncbi:MAG: hypothetical protein WAW97_03870, partial [Gemmiger qucibialis]